MATLAERLLEHGIRARHYRDGGQKLLCPRCSRDRKKPNDPCLSLTIEGERRRVELSSLRMERRRERAPE